MRDSPKAWLLAFRAIQPPNSSDRGLAVAVEDQETGACDIVYEIHVADSFWQARVRAPPATSKYLPSRRVA